MIQSHFKTVFPNPTENEKLCLANKSIPKTVEVLEPLLACGALFRRVERKWILKFLIILDELNCLWLFDFVIPILDWVNAKSKTSNWG